MLQRLYDWTMRLAGHRHALWWLALVAFVESSVFPIPPDVLLIPMVLAVRRRAWLLATVCTVASVLGGYLGYAIGALLFDTVGQPIIDFYGVQAAFDQFKARYDEAGAWIVAFFGVTPFPYKVITIASGVTHLDPLVFGLASVASRAVRFFLVAGLLWFFGEPIRGFVERYLGWVVLVFSIMLIAGFVVLKFLL